MPTKKKSSTKAKAVKKAAKPKRIIDRIATKRKQGAWFYKLRGSYLPISWQGWLSYLPYVALALLPLKAFYVAWVDCEDSINVFCSNDSVWIVTLRIIAATVIYYAILVSTMTIFAQRKC